MIIFGSTTSEMQTIRQQPCTHSTDNTVTNTALYGWVIRSVYRKWVSLHVEIFLLELSELNFDVVKRYKNAGEDLPGFKKFIEKGTFGIGSEYENLEPWSQCSSVHAEKAFGEHNMFRLGDFINSVVPQKRIVVVSCFGWLLFERTV